MRRLVVVLLVIAASSAAAASPPADLPASDIFDSAGKFSPLPAATYQASMFPLPVRLTVAAGWSGAQWKANNFSPQEIARRHLKCPFVCKPPYFGWLAIAKGGLSNSSPPEALILVMTGYDRTPSVAATVADLRSPTGVSYEPSTRVRLAGFAATQFGGETVGGSNHFFTPFTSSHGAAGSTPDSIEIDGAGHPFRFTVMSVNGKTIVVLVGSLVLSADRFQAFLPQADRVLATLKFTP